MDDSLNICLSCGLCCDGTLIGFVQLSSDEMPALKEIMEIEDTHGNGFFLHPCSKFCDGCTIYSKRPKQCGLFKCGLLKSVEQKELGFDTAVGLIEEVKQRKIGIQEKLSFLQLELQSQSFYFKMVELKNLLKKITSESSLSQNYLELQDDLYQLDRLLIEKFGVSLD
jgi:uncharacterized protein